MNKKYAMSRNIRKTLPMVALAASLLLPGVAASADKVVVIPLFSKPAHSAPAAATGVTTCYDSAGVARACADTGEDGEH